MALEMFHGTCYANHASIMRDGLRPARHGGPFVSSVRSEAEGYAVASGQEHRHLTGDRECRAIAYRLQVPEDKVRRSPAKGAYRSEDEFCVPGGVPRAWFVDATVTDVPPDGDPRLLFSDEFVVAGRALMVARDSGPVFQRQLQGLGFSPRLAEQIAAGFTKSMADPFVFDRQNHPSVASRSPRGDGRCCMSCCIKQDRSRAERPLTLLPTSALRASLSLLRLTL